MAGGFIWDPVGSDGALSRACLDVQAGRFSRASEVLAECTQDFGLRAHRSAVLASAAAGSDVVERFMAEEGTVDGLLWYARVAVVRALRAADGGDERAQDLTALAARACVAAADAAPGDPTPWTAMLALARLGHSAVPGPEGVDAKGPWDLAEQAQRRDPWNREAHLRLLACFYPRHGGSGAAMWEVADWASRTAPENSAVRLLPLWAYAEHYRSRSGAQAVNADRQWSTEFAEYRAMNLYDGWFLPTQRSAYYQQYVPVADYSLLAHALYAHGRRRREASVVLHAMGPYASSYPWSLFGDPAQQLVRARATCGLIPP